MALVEFWIGNSGPFLADDVADAAELAQGGQVVTKDDLAAAISTETIPEAPNDGKIYVRRNKAWEELVIS